MKDMNWPERVAYLENQLADSDRENQRLSEFIKGLPDGDETPAQLAEAQRFRRSTMYWHERAMKAEAHLAEAEALLREARASIPCNAKFTLRRIDAFLATADSATVALEGE